MPQAFGPFTDLQIKSDMIQIFNNSDLIFIRDNVSMKYVKEIIKISDEKFYLYPDFTNLYKVNKKLISNKFKGSVCIIPNSRMIDKKNNNYQLYLNFFKLIIDYFILNDIKFYFLIHSSDERKSKISDLDIIKLLIEDDDIHIDIVKLEDPKLIKMQISNSKFIISSRFHGLINGLSQNIPSIATSWSHKYKELLGLYYHLSYLIILGFDCK